MPEAKPRWLTHPWHAITYRNDGAAIRPVEIVVYLPTIIAAVIWPNVVLRIAAVPVATAAALTTLSLLPDSNFKNDGSPPKKS